MSLNELAAKIHANAVDHGFWEGDRPFTETIALCHAELSEALEEHRAGRPDVYLVGSKPEGRDIEVVDCLIRILDYLGHKDADIDALVDLKHGYNATRPYKHGKSY